MADHIVRVLEIIPRTHNVNSFRVEKPSSFLFEPGQATDLSILYPGWEQQKRPFTFTSLPEDAYLEFTIKSYHDHDGVTHQLNAVKKGDKFEISDAWGAISYKGEGVFIAGGAGVTPFIAIFRYLNKKGIIADNQLFFSNRTEKDIILRDEFESILGKNFINVITDQPDTKYYKQKIDRNFIKEHVQNFHQQFYVCGPEAFNTSILDALAELGVHPDTLVFEK